MKRILTTGITALMVVFFSSAAFSQKHDETNLPKDTRHIKLVKIVDGKKMALDTVINGKDLLVWQGDTINPPKHIAEFTGKAHEKLQRYDVRVDDKDGKKQVMIFSSDGLKGTNPFVWHADSTDEVEMNLSDGDTTGHKIIIHKRIKDGNEEHIFSFDEPDMKHFPPVPPAPPMPPVPHFKMLKHFPDSRVIDLNDPDIISYKRKDMSGGREKIEIIRKKSDKKEMTFEFKDGDHLITPGMTWKDNQGKQMKIIEKKVKVDGKDGKQVEVQVETDDNK